jgi:hypothetical protein
MRSYPEAPLYSRKKISHLQLILQHKGSGYAKMPSKSCTEAIFSGKNTRAEVPPLNQSSFGKINALQHVT